MEGRNKKLLLSLLVLVLLVSIGKETYALFTNEVSSVVQSYGTGTLKLSYSNTSINLDNAYPLTDKDGMNQDVNTITITNTGTLAYKFNVILDPSSDSTISSSLIRVSMDGESPATLSSDGNVIIRDVILNPGSSRTFTIKLWINSNTSSSAILNKKFSASLTSTGIAVKDMEDNDGTVLVGVTGPLYDYIKRKADTITQIDFSKTSSFSNTNGIYMTTDTDSGSPVYYYRGNVDNHLMFANFCWRIVRTTETGGVKLIYDGVPSNGQCNNTGSNSTIGSSAFNLDPGDTKYVGYMYGSSIDDTANTTDSTAKTTVDTWYKNNMTSYASQLEDTVFCNDRSYTIDDSVSDLLYFGAYTRLTENMLPTLKCQNTRDKFTTNASNGNGALTYPVGLITADEMAYAGGVFWKQQETKTAYYLYSGVAQWSLSPYTSDEVYSLDNIGSIDSLTVFDNDGWIRPSVSLKPGIEVTGGSGTAEDPFVIAKLLYNEIKDNADTTTTIDFSKTSEQDNTNGIYMTTDTDSGSPVYYYRGNVDNHVLFANLCWRIIRTTETGGVKLIYDGVPSNGQCNNTGSNSTIGSSKFNESYNDNAYVGYMYGTAGSSTYASTHANTNDSKIKGVIDTWYKNNMTSYTSQLEDAVWCNDRSIVTDLVNSNGGIYRYFTTLGYGENATLYGPASRVGYKVSNPTPTLKCAQDNDKFTMNASNGNGVLTYPVGLITADEMTYAGGAYGSSNTNSSFYLYTGQNYWSLSPNNFAGSPVYEFYLDSAGTLVFDIVTGSRGVRPSVSLQPGIGMTGGSGTAADPFVIG